MTAELRHMNDSLIESEAHKCIEIHSHLFTCLYNWAASHTLHKRRIICWSTTAAYYAMMHAVRTLFSTIQFLPEFDEKITETEGQTKRDRLQKVLGAHERLCLFLRGKKKRNNEEIDLQPENRDKGLRDTCISCFVKVLSHSDSYWNNLLKESGEILTAHKRAREAKCYEHFVIAHHGRGYHLEYPFVLKIFEKSEEHLNRFIPKILSYLIEFYGKDHPLRHFHLNHLKDELVWLHDTIRKESLIVPKQMNKFLERIKKLTADISVDLDEYFRFTDYMDKKRYTRKAEVYREFENIAEKLANLRL